MKLTTMTQVTVDGVMQANGPEDVDRGNGSERGGWAMGAGDNQTRAFITQTYQHAGAFLFGRRTYELFAGSWGAIDEMRARPIGVALKQTPKYVASTTLTGAEWADTTILSGDLAAAIGKLKAKPAGELQVHGSGALIRWLLENDLGDEMTPLIVPVVLGQGARGCSRTAARTLRLTWPAREPTRRAYGPGLSPGRAPTVRHRLKHVT